MISQKQSSRFRNSFASYYNLPIFVDCIALYRLEEYWSYVVVGIETKCLSAVYCLTKSFLGIYQMTREICPPIGLKYQLHFFFNLVHSFLSHLRNSSIFKCSLYFIRELESLQAINKDTFLVKAKNLCKEFVSPDSSQSHFILRSIFKKKRKRSKTRGDRRNNILTTEASVELSGNQSHMLQLIIYKRN